MKIRILSTTKKKLNVALIIGLIVSIGPWLIIFPWMMFDKDGSIFTALLMMLSIAAIFITIIISLITFFIQPTTILEQHSDYELLINSENEISEINKESHLRYGGNFLKNSTLDLKIEIDNKEALSLLKNRAIQPLLIKTEKRETTFLEESPKEWFNSLMDIGWAAS